jgi:MFS family permease
MAAAPSLVVAIVGAAIAGVGNGIVFVAGRTALQEAVTGGWMALMMSLNESIYQAVPGIGIVVGGAITATAGARLALAVAGIGCVATSFGAWLTLLPESLRSARPRMSEEPAPVDPLTEAGRRRQTERGTT